MIYVVAIAITLAIFFFLAGGLAFLLSASLAAFMTLLLQAPFSWPFVLGIGGSVGVFCGTAVVIYLLPLAGNILVKKVGNDY